MARSFLKYTYTFRKQYNCVSSLLRRNDRNFLKITARNNPDVHQSMTAPHLTKNVHNHKYLHDINK